MPGKDAHKLYEEWKLKVNFMELVSMMILKYKGVVTWGKERSFQQFHLEEPGVE